MSEPTTTRTPFTPGDVVEVRAGARKGDVAKVYTTLGYGRVVVEMPSGQGWTYAERSLKLIASAADIEAAHAEALAENGKRSLGEAVRNFNAGPRLELDHAEALAENARRAAERVEGRWLARLAALVSAGYSERQAVLSALNVDHGRALVECRRRLSGPARWDPRGALRGALPATDRQLHMALGADMIGPVLIRSILARLAAAEARA